MKLRAKIRLFFTAALLTMATLLHAQTTCKSSAPSQVAVGQTFNYSIVLNEKATNIAPMNFNHFNVLGGPNQSFSSSSSWVNGQHTTNVSYTYSYVLQAKQEGTFTIPAATVTVENQQVKSNAVTINVVAASQQAQTQPRGRQPQRQQAPAFDKNDIFVKAYASKSTPYEGEEVIITHKLYVGAGVNGGYQVTGVNAPTMSGFWSYTLGDPNAEAPQTSEIINGKRYNVHEIRRTAVFPQKSGKLTVTPFELDFVGRVLYSVQSNDPFDFFFGGGQRAQDYELKLKSNSVNLEVKPLPTANQPADFNGVVGNFTMNATLSRDQLNANDATNFVVTISGHGNLQHIDNLNVSFPADFDVTEPQISDNINTRGSNVNGSRSFEYVLIPRSAGKFTLEAATFSFFDTKTRSYKTLETPPFDITVEKGNGDAAITTSSANQKEIKVLGNDIRFIKTDANAFHPKRAAFFGTAWYYLLLLFPLLLFVLFIIIWRKKLDNRANMAQVRNRRANKVARKRLKKAQKLLQNNEKEPFFVEISQVLWGYMSDKFHIPLSQLSMETVETKLKEKQLSDEAIQDFLTTLNQCEFARFAPGDSSTLMNEMYQLSLQFITKIEKKN